MNLFWAVIDYPFMLIFKIGLHWTRKPNIHQIWIQYQMTTSQIHCGSYIEETKDSGNFNRDDLPAV